MNIPGTTRARNRALDRADPLGRADALADALADDLDRACAIADAPAHDLAGDLADALDCARARAGDLAYALARARQRADAHKGESRERAGAVRVLPAAGRLVIAAARLLPAADRARYCEECRSELWELAAARAGRRQQILYAVRQCRSAVPLRFALLTPRRRNASL